MTVLFADRSFSRQSTSHPSHPSHPITLPGRRSPKTGRPATIIASLFSTSSPHAADPLTRRRLNRTPEEKLWLAIFESLSHDARAGTVHSADLDLNEKCRLDFVAWALGWPVETLPRIFSSAAEERAKGRRKGMKLVANEKSKPSPASLLSPRSASESFPCTRLQTFPEPDL